MAAVSACCFTQALSMQAADEAGNEGKTEAKYHARRRRRLIRQEEHKYELLPMNMMCKSGVLQLPKPGLLADLKPPPPPNGPNSSSSSSMPPENWL